MDKLFLWHDLLKELSRFRDSASLSDFLGSVRITSRDNSELKDEVINKDLIIKTLAAMQIKGLIHCYSQSESKRIVIRVDETDQGMKIIEMTVPGKIFLAESKVPIIHQGANSTNVVVVNHQTSSPAVNDSDSNQDGKKPEESNITILVASKRDSVPTSPSIDKIVGNIASRQGQARFREALLNLFSYSCCITGCNVVDVLEAAHVDPFSRTQNNSLWNGLILRPDIHTLFDLRLLALRVCDDVQCKIVLHSRLRTDNSFLEYRNLHGNDLHLPPLSNKKLSKLRANALQSHLEACQATHNELFEVQSTPNQPCN